MDLGGALQTRRAVADDAAHPHQAGTVGGGEHLLDHRGEGLAVVGVRHIEGGPAVGLETAIDVLGEGDVGLAIDGHVVVVVDPAEVAQLEVAGGRGRLAGHALHQVAVAAHGPYPVAVDLEPGPVEALLQPPLGHGHADAVRRALAEGTGGRLHTGSDPVLRVTRADAVHLAESLEIVERHRGLADLVTLLVDPFDPGQVDQRIEQHRGMAAGQHEAIPVRPGGILWVVAEEPRPQGVGDRRQAHGRAGVAGVGLLHRVDREGPDRVDGDLVDIAGGRLR